MPPDCRHQTEKRGEKGILPPVCEHCLEESRKDEEKIYTENKYLD